MLLPPPPAIAIVASRAGLQLLGLHAAIVGMVSRVGPRLFAATATSLLLLLLCLLVASVSAGLLLQPGEGGVGRGCTFRCLGKCMFVNYL